MPKKARADAGPSAEDHSAAGVTPGGDGGEEAAAPEAANDKESEPDAVTGGGGEREQGDSMPSADTADLSAAPADHAAVEEAGAAAQSSEQENPLWTTVKAAPWDFDSWAALISVLERAVDTAALREAYEGLLTEFPLCYAYWEKYARMEGREHGKDAQNTIFDRGVAAVPCVELWSMYCTAMVEAMTGDDGTPALAEARYVFERAVTAVGNYWGAGSLWDMYVTFEEERREDGIAPKVAALCVRAAMVRCDFAARFHTKFETLLDEGGDDVVNDAMTLLPDEQKSELAAVEGAVLDQSSFAWLRSHLKPVSPAFGSRRKHATHRLRCCALPLLLLCRALCSFSPAWGHHHAVTGSEPFAYTTGEDRKTKLKEVVKVLHEKAKEAVSRFNPSPFSHLLPILYPASSLPASAFQYCGHRTEMCPPYCAHRVRSAATRIPLTRLRRVRAPTAGKRHSRRRSTDPTSMSNLWTRTRRSSGQPMPTRLSRWSPRFSYDYVTFNAPHTPQAPPHGTPASSTWSHTHTASNAPGTAHLWGRSDNLGGSCESPHAGAAGPESRRAHVTTRHHHTMDRRARERSHRASRPYSGVQKGYSSSQLRPGPGDSCLSACPAS